MTLDLFLKLLESTRYVRDLHDVKRDTKERNKRKVWWMHGQKDHQQPTQKCLWSSPTFGIQDRIFPWPALGYLCSRIGFFTLLSRSKFLLDVLLLYLDIGNNFNKGLHIFILHWSSSVCRQPLVISNNSTLHVIVLVDSILVTVQMPLTHQFNS